MKKQEIIERIKMIENLKEIGSLTLDSKEFKKIMPEVHFFLEDEFKGFVADPNNEATEEELQDFQEGNYLVELLFKEEEVVYFIGADAQQLANEPRWGEDDWSDIRQKSYKHS